MGCVQVTEWLTAKQLRISMHQKQIHTSRQIEEVRGKHTQNVTKPQRIALEISFDLLKDRITWKVHGKVVCKGFLPTPSPLFIACQPLATGVLEFMPFPPSLRFRRCGSKGHQQEGQKSKETGRVKNKYCSELFDEGGRNARYYVAQSN